MDKIMFFGLFTRKDMNQGVDEWRKTKGAVLLDVRTEKEYADYHIEGSVNIPLDRLDTANSKIPDKTIPIFIYCLSGARSATAAAYFKRNGYSCVRDIGGINTYRGETVSCNI